MQNQEITRPYQVIVEGASDDNFFDGLLANRGITGFQVSCGTIPPDKRCAGVEGFTHRLLALNAFSSLNPGVVRGIVLVKDTDENPAAALSQVQAAIRDTKLKLPIPSSLLEIKAGDPAIAIMTIPWCDSEGHLDTLVYNSLLDQYPILTSEDGPIEGFCKATEPHRTGWSFGNVSKFKLRCLLATLFRKDPGKALSYVLKTDTVNFGHQSFDRMANFFTAFAATLD